jgi:MFS family permease
MVLSQTPSLWPALAILVLVGLSTTFYLTQINTVLQQHVPDALRGRVLSIYSLNWSLLPIGGVLASSLAALVDARFAILAGSAVVVSSALLLGLRARLWRAGQLG